MVQLVQALYWIMLSPSFRWRDAPGSSAADRFKLGFNDLLTKIANGYSEKISARLSFRVIYRADRRSIKKPQCQTR